MVTVGIVAFVLGSISAELVGQEGGPGPELHSSFTFPYSGIWVSREALSQLPVSGPAWERLKRAADEPIARPDLSDQDSEVNVHVLAKALVYARTGDPNYRDEVISACMLAMGTAEKGNALALGKQLLGYVLAADLVGLPEDKQRRFKSWLRNMVGYEFPSGKTLSSTHEHRPNNWGTLAGASRVAVAAYLRDAPQIKRCAKVFKGWLGDRELYSGFRFKDRSWQANPLRPVGINPQGATKRGHPIGGVLPDDQRRAGAFTWPPPRENYVYTALQGAVAQAVILSRCGYSTWQWQDKALLRAFEWLYRVADYPAQGDDMWLPFVINAAYGACLPTSIPTKPGKNVAWTDWIYGQRPKKGTKEMETVI
jgi:hypothetical protein